MCVTFHVTCISKYSVYVVFRTYSRRLCLISVTIVNHQTIIPFPAVFMTSTFISITDQRLELGPEAENQGQFAGTSGKAIGTPLTSALGQCLPISSFERLNQLGEGSEFLPAKRLRNCTRLTARSLRRGLPRPKQEKLTNCRSQANPDLARRSPERYTYHSASRDIHTSLTKAQ